MLFGKKEIRLMAVCSGKCAPLTEFPDEAFSGGMLGVGVAISPTDSSFYAPIDGKILSVAETGHAFTVETDNGLDILIHIGVDTVSMGGEGFSPAVKEGDRVRAGDLLCTAELSKISSSGLSDMTALVIANPEKIKDTEFFYTTVTAKKDAVMTFRLREKG
jgi:glucose-specific phosphotransferase system IIA component